VHAFSVKGYLGVVFIWFGKDDVLGFTV
jgi:hypothetical protein